MNKLSNPLGNGKEVWITQTNHGASANIPSDFRNHVAIDTSGSAGTLDYASANGVCSATIGVGSARYFYLDVDNSPIRILYVHSKSHFSKSTHVKNQQVIGEIIPYEYYKDGIKMRADHLHWGLQNKNGETPHPLPMEYIDRTIVFKTRYPSIEKLWFKNGTINWAIFRDKDYLQMKYPKGTKVIFTGDQNLRNGKGVDTGDVIKGAVGEMMSDKLGSLPDSAGDYDWYNIKFLNTTGYVADINKFTVTTKPITQTDGKIPNPCQTQIDEITRLTTIVQAQEIMVKDMIDEETNLNSQIETMTKEAEKLQQALTKYADEKIKWEEDKTKLNLKIDDLKTQLTAKKAEVVAKLTVIETLHLALQKVWDKFFPGEN
jgi:hypothetical protein